MSTCCSHDFPDKWTWNHDMGRWERECPGCHALQYLTGPSLAPTTVPPNPNS